MWLDSVHVSCCIVHLHVQFGMVNSTTEYLLMCSFFTQESKSLTGGKVKHSKLVYHC